MRKSILIISILIAWFMAAMFNQIKTITGIEIDALLYAAIITMIFGLYKGLRKSNKDQPEEEL